VAAKEAMQARRSISNYKDSGVTQEQIDALLTAAWLAMRCTLHEIPFNIIAVGAES
jgi:nitroreductase